MKITPHRVVALSPEAFAFLAESPFPCAPRYGRELGDSLTRVCHRPRGRSARSEELLRCKLWSSLTGSRSCFYPKERFTLEPANTIRLSNVLVGSIAHPFTKRKRKAEQNTVLLPTTNGALIPRINHGGFPTPHTVIPCTSIHQGSMRTASSVVDAPVMADPPGSNHRRLYILVPLYYYVQYQSMIAGLKFSVLKALSLKE